MIDLFCTSSPITAVADVEQQNGPPQLEPSLETQVLDEGMSFDLRCYGSFPLDWDIPPSAISANISTTRCRSCPPEQTYQSSVHIDDMAYYMTGSYECFYSRQAERRDNSTSTGVYVFVRSASKLIASCNPPFCFFLSRCFFFCCCCFLYVCGKEFMVRSFSKIFYWQNFSE